MTLLRDAEIQEQIRLMARVGNCWSPSFSPDQQQLAFVSDLTGSPQVWRIPIAGGFPEAVTAFEEQVISVIWSPAGSGLAVESAPGGGMNAQIDIVRADGSERKRLTSGGSSNNWLNMWSKDGQYVLFSSNRETADAMDSFRVCVETGAVEKVASNCGTGIVTDVTADGGRALVKRVVYRGDNNIFLVNLSDGQERLLSAHDPPAAFENARFSSDFSHVYCISNRDRDLACLCRRPLRDGGEWTLLQSRDDAELDEFALSAGDQVAALVWNTAGRHELELINLEENRTLGMVTLPGEIVDSLRFSRDGTLLAICISGARLPRDIWLLDTSSLTLRQITRSPHIGVNLQALAGANLIEYIAHDGLNLSGWFYAPPDREPPYATVLSFHGGPEGQEQPSFRYDYQALVSQGIAIFAPNVRGSSGFGKRFVNLDNGALRFNALRDIASTAAHLTESGIADAGQLGIMGGSYGGYMTMAGLAEYPELFAAGVNLFGVVNFKTFFEHTEAWMASISKIEYGDPETEGDLLDALSPINKLDRVVAPTLVLHGANDTNVPVYEAEQVVDALRARAIPVEYILFPDEGHGFRKESNRVTTAVAIVDWFVRYLLK